MCLGPFREKGFQRANYTIRSVFRPSSVRSEFRLVKMFAGLKKSFSSKKKKRDQVRGKNPQSHELYIVEKKRPLSWKGTKEELTDFLGRLASKRRGTSPIRRKSFLSLQPQQRRASSSSSVVEILLYSQSHFSLVCWAGGWRVVRPSQNQLRRKNCCLSTSFVPRTFEKGREEK